MLDWFTSLTVWDYRELIWQGLSVTLYITLLSFALSVVVALIVVFLRISRNRFASAIGSLYIEVGRDTPILVTLLWTTYVLPPLIGIRIPVFWTATIALVLQTSGYLAETFRGGIESIPKGQTQASQALGMTYSLMMRRIVLPQALRQSIPDILNNFVVLFKTSTLVSIVAVPDLMYQATRLVAQLFKPVEIYTSVAVIYLVLVFGLSSIIRGFQRRWRERETAGMAD